MLLSHGSDSGIQVFPLVAMAHVVARQSSLFHHASTAVVPYERLPFGQTDRSARVMLRTRSTSFIPDSVDASIQTKLTSLAWCRELVMIASLQLARSSWAERTSEAGQGSHI